MSTFDEQLWAVSVSAINTASHKLTSTARVRSTAAPALRSITDTSMISPFTPPRRAARRTKPLSYSGIGFDFFRSK